MDSCARSLFLSGWSQKWLLYSSNRRSVPGEAEVPMCCGQNLRVELKSIPTSAAEARGSLGGND